MNLQAVTIKDSDNNMQWNEGEGLLTYRARKVYSFVPELSAEGFKDPDNIFVTGNTIWFVFFNPMFVKLLSTAGFIFLSLTIICYIFLVPNIPFWTGLNKIRKESGIKRSLGLGLITSNGGVEPFVNVSIHGLLWGYPGSAVSERLI